MTYRNDIKCKLCGKKLNDTVYVLESDYADVLMCRKCANKARKKILRELKT